MEDRIALKVFIFMPQKLGADVREGKRRQFNYIGNCCCFFFFVFPGVSRVCVGWMRNVPAIVSLYKRKGSLMWLKFVILRTVMLFHSLCILCMTCLCYSVASCLHYTLYEVEIE